MKTKVLNFLVFIPIMLFLFLTCVPPNDPVPEITYYTITFDKNNAGATGTMPPQTFAEESAANLAANGFAVAGWVFTGWATAADGAVVYTDGASYTMAATDASLYAKWAANDYMITFDKNNANATGTIQDQTLASGSIAVLTANAYTLAGQAFTGWATTAGGSVAYTDGASYTMGTENATLYAQWNGNNYAITFDKNDAGAAGTMPDEMIASGSAANLAANGFSKTGWTFTGWATTAGGSVAYADEASYTMGTDNATLYARWTGNNYTIDFDKNDAGATGTMPPQTIASGSAANLAANGFSKTGWSFTGWSETAGGSAAYTNGASYTMGTASVTLYAKWTVNDYSITFDKNDAGAAGSMSLQTLASGSAANLAVNGYSLAGWTFAGWAETAGGSVAYANGASYTMGAANVTLYARWNADTYTVTFDSQGGTAVTNKTVTSPATTVDALPTAPTRIHYVFSGWFTAINGGGTEFIVSTIVTADITVYAKWDLILLSLNKTVTVSSIEGAGYEGANAVDASLVTLWRSADTYPASIYVDLGASYTITEVVLNWENCAGGTYYIETSPQAAIWTTIATKEDFENGSVDTFSGLSAMGRYVKITALDTLAGPGVSLYGFRIYGY